ncbi:MAG: hypothetical protein KKE37_09455 [Verrucomicrobia bacterium]|nr:hypothetical protein [Verrucomicrobiota bacterium]MBU4291620.1 hypothetical protein [Verrucomicrobiota bacterium]MBU4429563.1 hypothetical protein [Verrucomicrobiota bacterium]MCG2681847.1 hypothetical protein [Kiritimatiellia bacterium]
MNKQYDPMLDPRCTVTASDVRDRWCAQWIWFPGQRVAHLHALTVRRMAERCVYVGYPGRFRLPIFQAFFRTTAMLTKPRHLRWAGPLGRIRVTIDGVEGNATRRGAELPAGRHDLYVVVDFGNRLPAIILEGGELSTGPEWESSLDGHTWFPTECEPLLSDPKRLPDDSVECRVIITPKEVQPVDSRPVKALAVVHDEIALPPGQSVLIDFGHDELGRLCFDATGCGLVECVVGESAEEALNDEPAHFEQHPLASAPMGSVRLPERCVRFARLKSTAGCTIRNLRFEARVWPTEYQGEFECSDSLLNDIWKAGAATLHTCTHDFILDGIRRDALPWALDAIAAIESSDCIFFDSVPARNHLVSQLLPSAPSDIDIGILDFPLYVPMGFEHDYLVRGDLSFSKRYRTSLTELLDFYISKRNAAGWLGGSGSWGCLADWTMTPEFGPDSRGICTYVQMLLMRSLEIGAAFNDRWGESDLARRYRQEAILLRQRIREEFWDPARGAYINGYTSSGKRDDRLSVPAQVFGIFFDLICPEEYPGAIDGVLENFACRPTNVSLIRHWEFLAYAKANRLPQALDFVKRVWGRLLSLGHVRFAEDIRPNDSPVEQLAFYGRPFGNSLCHEWAGAAPVALLSKGVLGISATGPGFSTCDLILRESGLDWFRGVIPTPRGMIQWSYDRSGGRLILPKGVTMRLVGCRLKSGAAVIEGEGELTRIYHTSG